MIDKMFFLVSWTLLVLCGCCWISGSEELGEIRSWYMVCVYLPSWCLFMWSMFRDFQQWQREMKRSEQ